MLGKDDGRHWVAVLKFGIVGKVGLEKLDLLLVDVARLDGREDAGLLAVVHLPGRGRLDQRRGFGAGGSGNVPEVRGGARPRGQRRAHDGHAPRRLGDVGVAAGEDQFLLRRFAVSLRQMCLFADDGWAVPLAGLGPAFGFGLGSLAGRLLGALGLLRLQGVILAADAEETVQDVRGSLLQVHLARAHCLLGGAQDLLLGHCSYWSARQL